MKKKLLLILGFLFIFGIAGAFSAQTIKADNIIYRLYNRNSGEHFYTASSSEYNIGASQQNI